MPSPSPNVSLTSTRADLAGSLVEFDVDANSQRMIGHLVFPKIEVTEQAGQFGKITLESLMKSVDTKRKSTGYNSTDFEFETDTYATNEHGVRVPVDQRNARMYDSFFDAELIAAQLSRSKVAINYENRVASLVFDSATFTPTSVTNEWDDAANAAPIDDVEDAIQRLYDKGIIGNALVINWKVFRKLRNVNQIIDRITASGAGAPTKTTDITLNMLRSVFDIEHILVGGSQENTANEGQTASLSPIWSSEYAAIMRITRPDGPISDVCAGRTFHWGEDGSVMGGMFESYFSDEERADVVRNRMDTDEKIIYPEAVELLDNITT